MTKDQERRGRRGRLFPLLAVMPLVLALGLLAAMAAGLFLDPRKVPSALVGKPAPHFLLPLVNAPEQSASPARMKNQVWLLNVWASWCVGCRVEHPLLFELNKEAPIVGLNYKDKSEDAKRYLKEEGDPYLFSLADGGGAGLDWGVYGVPETFVIDAGGIVRHKHIGVLDRQAIAETIAPLVRELKAQKTGESR